MMGLTRESQDVGGRKMTLAIVLGGWTLTSVLLTPLIGMFLCALGGSKDFTPYRRNNGEYKASSSNKTRLGGYGTVRRNVAPKLYRREARGPRTG
jgi:hypothetical protein